MTSYSQYPDVLEMTKDMLLDGHMQLKAGMKAKWADGTGKRVYFQWEQVEGAHLGEIPLADLDQLTGCFRMLTQ